MSDKFVAFEDVDGDMDDEDDGELDAMIDELDDL